ncbi:MAG: hypothetical protein JNN26_17290 [Candidatus Obscuribacter sp.]|nr:hypothetical protein [Candidatus Obscuribacter sp.]
MDNTADGSIDWLKYARSAGLVHWLAMLKSQGRKPSSLVVAVRTCQEYGALSLVPSDARADSATVNLKSVDLGSRPPAGVKTIVRVPAHRQAPGGWGSRETKREASTVWS